MENDSGGEGYPSKGEARPRRSHLQRASVTSTVSTAHISHMVADVTWVAAFQKLKNPGDRELHKDSLIDLLISLAHPEPDQDLARSIADRITEFNYMDDLQVYEFIRDYEDELHIQLRTDFKGVAQKHGGRLPLTELNNLVRRKGYTPIPHAIREILTEVSAELGELGEVLTGSSISMKVFMKLMDTLEQNEGFCASDLRILDSAFQRFDKNNSGTIEVRELRPLLESLDFFLDAGVVEKLVGHFFKDDDSKLTRANFLSISRKRVHLEFDLFEDLFKRCDDDRDGLLQPPQVMRLVSKLGVSLLPETFVDLMEECHIESEAVDYPAVWKMLQALRAREGFTQKEAAEVGAVFSRFDSSGQGRLPRKRVPAAIQWLGYLSGPGLLGKAHKQVEVASASCSSMTESQFLRLARKHREAEMKVIRKVFRAFAADGGAGKLQMENMHAAVTRLNRLFVNDFHDWIKMYRPGARFAKRHVSFDFEEFRMIAVHCCEQNKQRIRQNCGFSEVELSMFRIEFVKYTKDDSSAEVDAAGLMKLFKMLIPDAQTTPTVHKRLKKAVESEKAHAGIDWHGFLRVMMTYAELTEAFCERRIRACLESLKISSEMADDALDIAQRICEGANVSLPTILERRSDATKAENPVTLEEVQLLLRGVAPQLTTDQAADVLECIQDANATQGELMGLKNLKSILLDSELVKRSNPKAHDLSGTF